MAVGKISTAGSRRDDVLVTLMALSFPKVAPLRITGESPSGDRMAMNHRISSYMRADNQFGGDGAMRVGNTRGWFCLVQSNNSHTTHIWTTMDFDSKWEVHSPDHVFILSSTRAD